MFVTVVSIGVVFVYTTSVGDAEPVRYIRAVVYVYPRCDDEISFRGLPCASYGAEQKTRPVFVSPAEPPGTVSCRQKLTEQISVAAFYIDAVEPRPLCEPGGFDERVEHAVEVSVVNDFDGAAVFLKSVVMVRDERRGRSLRLRVSAGVRRLHYHERLGKTRSVRRFFYFLDEAGKLPDVAA